MSFNLEIEQDCPFPVIASQGKSPSFMEAQKASLLRMHHPEALVLEIKSNKMCKVIEAERIITSAVVTEGSRGYS